MATAADAPRPIRRLEETVVNRIAAGEVVQRPANALKELLENSLDAQATSIVVTVKDGGLKMLQIQDNGTGIRRDDLLIVCERFTTSKLTAFDDLLRLGTYGFRGEALASISHVARLSITTRTSDSKCAYRCQYSDGRPRGEPRPCAGNQGTQILVEDVFYNMAARKQALRSPAEEFQKVADVMNRYAIHNSSVGFTLKKQGETNVYLRTPPKASQLDNIRTVFGNSVAKELTEVTLEDSGLKAKVTGYVSGVNYAGKRFTMLLFINHRLVESNALRKALEQVYSAYLPRNTQPFVYLSLQLAPDTVDVNVHPTKNQVHFLHEDRIIEMIQKRVDCMLLGTSAARTFYTQTLLPGASAVANVEALADDSAANKARPQENVRTDYREQKLDRFLKTRFTDQPTAFDNTDPSEPAATESKPTSEGAACDPGDPVPLAPPTEVQLTSVQSLRAEVESRCHATLRQLISEHTFVGVASGEWTLLQHQTRLYLVNHRRLMEQLFYQLCLRRFSAAGLLQLDPPPSVTQLALIGLDRPEAGWTPADGPKSDLAEFIRQLLVGRAAMLDEYFSLQVDAEGRLLALPLLLDDHQPPLVALPLFLIRLASEVNWDTERDCLRDICREIARFYCWAPPPGGSVSEEERWRLQHVIFPALKRHLLPPASAAEDGTFLQIANLPDLYKVFERC